MTVWESEAVLEAVVDALSSVHLNTPGGHALGRPYLTAYQLAVKVQAANPQIASALGVEIGGVGAGRRTSLAQYLARELSKRIGSASEGGPSGPFPVEGAFLSNEHLAALHYQAADGKTVQSSQVGQPSDLSIFRLAAVADE